MKAAWTLTLLCFCAIAPVVSAQEPEKGAAEQAAAKAALLEEIRDRIIWYSEEKTNPLLVPEEVFGLVPFEELPIPEDDRQGIRMWISFQKDGRSPAGQPFPDCRYPRRVENEPVRSEEQKTALEVITRGPVSLLVAIEQTTRGYWPQEGIYQYNEFTPLKLLVGKDFLHQDPLAARAFLSEGGEIVVEGTRLCSLSPWHQVPPRRGDIYLLVGAPDDRGIFYSNYYFRIEDGNVAPAGYSKLKQPEEPLPLDRILASLRPASDKPSLPAISRSSCTGAPRVSPQEESGGTRSPANEALRDEIRGQIIWSDPDQTYPHVIPERVFGLLPFEELPIPESAKFPIRRWICLRNEVRPPDEDPYPECSYPETATHRLDYPPRRQISLEEAIATRMMAILVTVDKTTLGLWPSTGIFQYNEVTPLQVLASSARHPDPLTTRAFLSEGGEIVVDGTVLCSKSPWHETAPRKGDVYLLLGSVDIYGIFETSLYFRIEDGNIVPASYPELEPLEDPLPLARVLARLADLKKSEEIRRAGEASTLEVLQP